MNIRNKRGGKKEKLSRSVQLASTKAMPILVNDVETTMLEKTSSDSISLWFVLFLFPVSHFSRADRAAQHIRSITSSLPALLFYRIPLKDIM